MSITKTYQRLTPEEYQGLLDDRKAAAAFGLIEPNDWDEELDELSDLYYALPHPSGVLAENGRYLDIMQDWHALHFLLTGRAEMDTTEEPPPLGNVVLGGTPTKWEATYGMVRSLTPEEVKAVASALQQIREDDLSQSDLAAFTAARLYTYDDNPWDADDLDEIIDVFGLVRDFFAMAARDGDMVLLSSD